MSLRYLQAGEAIIITKEGISKQQCAPPKQYSPCIFEYVYFARPDTIMNGVSVYKARLAMGEALASQVRKSFSGPLEIDVVIPVSGSNIFTSLVNL